MKKCIHYQEYVEPWLFPIGERKMVKRRYRRYSHGKVARIEDTEIESRFAQLRFDL